MLLGLFKRYGFAAVVAVGLGLITLVVVGKTLFDGLGGESSAAPPGASRGGGPGDAPTVLAAATSMHTFTDGLQALGSAQARESIVLTPLVTIPSFALMIGITVLELLVAAIQAYVFALLTSLYLNDAINLH